MDDGTLEDAVSFNNKLFIVLGIYMYNTCTMCSFPQNTSLHIFFCFLLKLYMYLTIDSFPSDRICLKCHLIISYSCSLVIVFSGCAVW